MSGLVQHLESQVPVQLDSAYHFEIQIRDLNWWTIIVKKVKFCIVTGEKSM
jgi:hypothetical protein